MYAAVLAFQATAQSDSKQLNDTQGRRVLLRIVTFKDLTLSGCFVGLHYDSRDGVRSLKQAGAQYSFRNDTVMKRERHMILLTPNQSLKAG